MATNSALVADPALEGLRRRGQFLISGLLWAAAAGLVIVLSGYALILYHYAIALAERVRQSLGFAAPNHGPDWFMVAALAVGPIFCAFCIAALCDLVQTSLVPKTDELRGRMRAIAHGIPDGKFCLIAPALLNENSEAST